jgi:hypothetical protein
MNAAPRFIKLSPRQLALAWIGLALALPLGVWLARADPALATALGVAGVCSVLLVVLVSVSSAEAKARETRDANPALSRSDFLPWFPDRWWLRPLVGVALALGLVWNYGWFDLTGRFSWVVYSVAGVTFALGFIVHCVEVARGRATFLRGPPPTTGDPAIWQDPAEQQRRHPSG